MNKINICSWIFILGFVALAKETEATCRDKAFCRWFKRPNCLMLKSMCPKTCDACPDGSEVPQCTGGKIFLPCGGCDGTCDNPFPICPAICKPGCVCPKNKVLHKGRCIYRNQCPASKCPSNKVFSKCGGCEKTCANRHLRRPCPTVCRPGCICPRGTVWSNQLSKCVPENECPAVTCPFNKVFTKCGGCEKSCKDRSEVKPCTLQCRPGCFCPPNTYWSGQLRKCVPINQCPPPECSFGKVYKSCVDCVEKTCANKDEPQICYARCRPGCVCPSGLYFSRQQRKCVPQEECEGVIKCPANKVFQTCAGCDKTCENKDKPIMCNKKCQRKCACPRFTVWNEARQWCVHPKLCPTTEPEKCKGGKIFQPCGGCDRTCSNLYPICPAVCIPGCVCPKNKVLHKGRCIYQFECPGFPMITAEKSDEFELTMPSFGGESEGPDEGLDWSNPFE